MRVRFRLARWLLMAVFIASCDEPATAPPSAATLTISAPVSSVYEGDVVTFAATLRNAQGEPVPDAPLAWSVSDDRRALVGQGGVITALSPGAVVVRATSGALRAEYTLQIARLEVQSVQLLLSFGELSVGDVVPVGVRLDGQGGRIVTGRSVHITSDNPGIARIDASGRVRGIAEGTTTIRATADGIVGTQQLTVSGTRSVHTLRSLSGATLPTLVHAAWVEWNGTPEYHEVYMEAGELVLTADQQMRYQIDVRYAEYHAYHEGGQKRLDLRLTTREYDRGTVLYDWRGDLLLTSDFISPLSHTASPVSGGFNVRFRVPGDDTVLNLFYRREPQ